jgi:hypothetical protein
VNVEKTKIVVFGSRRCNINFKINSNNVEIVDQYKYLGIVFKKTGNFLTAKTTIMNQAKKAMYLLKIRVRHLNLPLDCQLLLFDQTVLPILTYGAEIWGFSNLDMMEKIHTDFLKYIFNVKRSTPHYMLYGELGRQPITGIIRQRIIMYWAKLVSDKQHKISVIMYNLLFSDSNNEYDWLKYVKTSLDNLGLNYLWLTQSVSNTNWLKTTIKQRISDQFYQNWHSSVSNSPKSLFYRIVKHNLNLENYLVLLPKRLSIPITKLRLGNHQLPIEKGRWENRSREERKCTHCYQNELGDEYHYLFICPFFADTRKKYIKPKYLLRPNTLRVHELFNSKSLPVLRNLSNFITNIFKIIS